MGKRAGKVQTSPKKAAVEEDGDEALRRTSEGWEAVKDAVQSLKAASQWHPPGRGQPTTQCVQHHAKFNL